MRLVPVMVDPDGAATLGPLDFQLDAVPRVRDCTVAGCFLTAAGRARRLRE